MVQLLCDFVSGLQFPPKGGAGGRQRKRPSKQYIRKLGSDTRSVLMQVIQGGRQVEAKHCGSDTGQLNSTPLDSHTHGRGARRG